MYVYSLRNHCKSQNHFNNDGILKARLFSTGFAKNKKNKNGRRELEERSI